MKEKKPTAKILIKICLLTLWSIAGVIFASGLTVILKHYKIDWQNVVGAVGIPAITWLWGWRKKQMESTEKATKEYRETVSQKFEILNNRMDRLTIQQQADESIREQLIEQQIEIERIKTEVNLSERLRFVEQIIHRFTNEKDINH